MQHDPNMTNGLLAPLENMEAQTSPSHIPTWRQPATPMMGLRPWDKPRPLCTQVKSHKAPHTSVTPEKPHPGSAPQQTARPCVPSSRCHLPGLSPVSCVPALPRRRAAQDRDASGTQSVLWGSAQHRTPTSNEHETPPRSAKWGPGNSHPAWEAS